MEAHEIKRGLSLKSSLVGKASNPSTSSRHCMDRVAYLTKFLPEIRFGMKHDFPWLTGTALGGGHGVGMFSQT
jgi:hypothetical protein